MNTRAAGCLQLFFLIIEQKPLKSGYIHQTGKMSGFYPT
jgi:hypothetical protein